VDPIGTLFAVLHLLVFVYWLGGDLGAFYASGILVDSSQPPASRRTAARVLSNIDMAPRTAMILAAPTGFTLASLQGWLSIEPWMLALLWVLALGWLALAWFIHLTHAPADKPSRKLDLAIRVFALSGLLAMAAGVITPLPLFIALKCALLALTIACGLAIRAALAPFGAAFGALARGAHDAQSDLVISNSIARAKPFVFIIWIALLAAAALGVATPLALSPVP